ncbi:MAG: sulfatase-like hydrolase/transferase [Bacteroidota bacterium]
MIRAYSLASVVALLLFSCISQREELTPPHIIYISVDDLGPFLGCYNYPLVQTPHLDAFAQSSLRFANAHCQVALCTPSRTSILTGIRPTKSGILQIDDDWQSVLPQAVSLPRHLRNHGYHTQAIGKIYDQRCGGMDSAFVQDDSRRLTSNRGVLSALDTLAQSKQPHFLAIGYSQPHTPWEPPAHFQARYKLPDIDLSNSSPSFRGDSLDDQQHRQKMLDYYATITEVDSLIGQVLGHIEQLKLTDRSIIIVGSLDHGFSLGWRGKWGKGNNYDPETQVPLFIRVPQQGSLGEVSHEPVELLDLYPTVLDYCNLPPPPQPLDGSSWRPIIEAPQKQHRQAAFSQRAYHPDDFGIKTHTHTLVYRETSGVQLFDRINDPLNLTDLSSQQPKIIDSLLQLRQEILSD